MKSINDNDEGQKQTKKQCSTKNTKLKGPRKYCLLNIFCQTIWIVNKEMLDETSLSMFLTISVGIKSTPLYCTRGQKNVWKNDGEFSLAREARPNTSANAITLALIASNHTHTHA